MLRQGFILLILTAMIGLFINPLAASAHPEDEFCTMDGGLDPALCRALQDLDRAEDPSQRASGFTETETIDFERPALETLGLYIEIGVRHILPGGLDHILFVLALFFAARRRRDLLIQISIFTAAHTVTLALAASGVIAPPASIVEPLIAVTISLVAVEAVFSKTVSRFRLGIIFVFGLIHGLGFAGFFGSLGLPAGQFWSALIGFNIGVEIGQLSVVLAALLLIWPIRRVVSEMNYTRFVTVPACLFIAGVGAFWAVERAFLS